MTKGQQVTITSGQYRGQQVTLLQENKAGSGFRKVSRLWVVRLENGYQVEVLEKEMK